MKPTATYASSGPRPGADTPAAARAQGAAAAPGFRWLHARSILALRLVSLAGQVLMVGVVSVTLKFPIPFAACFLLIGLGIAVTLGSGLNLGVARQTRRWQPSAEILFDLFQRTSLLFLTGGIVNPFSLLLIVPVTLACATLTPRRALIVAILGGLCAVILTLAATPISILANDSFLYSPIYRGGCLVAVLFGMTFAGGYAAWVAAEGKTMALALHVTETVLAREQRLSALGGLAAAAAHELGTPLATMAVVAKELAREAPEGSLRDDALLLVEQAQRCREILKRLAETPEAGDALYERMSLLQLAREVLAPYSSDGPVRAEAVVTGAMGVPAPDLWRRAEVMHALASIVENAFDFARMEILITARFDADTVAIEVRDDGPGFSAEVLARLGEPYVTSRPGAEGSRTGHIGMGLGFFIAKTLLERTGARVIARNGHGAGAVVTITWPRDMMEAKEPAAPSLFGRP